jgi:4-hydroxy-4-methyl-2-oxoglutarate aldolase
VSIDISSSGATEPDSVKFTSATAFEALGGKGALPSAIKPIAPGMYVAGRAVTVSSPPGDNLRLHEAIYLAEEGDVLVVHCSGDYQHGYWGEIMTVAAMERRIAGLVIDGCVRDGERIAELGFPVFARGLCIIGTGKDPAKPGAVNVPISIDNLQIDPGDFIIADTDGVVAVRSELFDELTAAHRERESREIEQLERLRSGSSTLDIFGFAVKNVGATPIEFRAE